MQDGDAIPAEAAGEWLREHFKDDPEPKVSIEWETGPALSPTKRARLLEILFGEDAAA